MLIVPTSTKNRRYAVQKAVGISGSLGRSPKLPSHSAQSAEWRHLFFLEMDGHITDRAVLTAVEELRRIARYAKVLGSYPRPG